MHVRSQFFQLSYKWVIVWKLEQLEIYSTHDIWKLFQTALALRVAQFWENLQISLVVYTSLIALAFIRLPILLNYYRKGYPVFNLSRHFFHRRAVVFWSMPWMCFNLLVVWWRRLLILQQTGISTLILDSRISQKTSKIGIIRYSRKGRFVLFDLNSKIICVKLGTLLELAGKARGEILYHWFVFILTTVRSWGTFRPFYELISKFPIQNYSVAKQRGDDFREF